MPRHKGFKHSPETIEKMRLVKLGDKNPYWKGNSVGNKGLHGWLRRHLPKPELCQICNTKPPNDIANVTGLYNRDFDNWFYLCRGCHVKRDGIGKNLKQDGNKRSSIFSLRMVIYG